jgi:SH3 domain protein
MKKLNRFNPLVLITLVMTLSSVSSNSFAVQAGYTNYVTDTSKIPLRSNPGYKYKIIRMLKPGSKVTISEVNDDGWAKVVYQYKGNSIDGWMPSIVLQNIPIAKHRLQKEITKTSAIEKKYNQLKVEMDALTNRHDEINRDLTNIKTENFQLENELNNLKAISGKSIEMNKQNAEYTVKIQKLNSENAILKERVSEAEDIVQRQWFLTGGGVLLLGLLLGRFFRLPAKKNKWNSL